MDLAIFITLLVVRLHRFGEDQLTIITMPARELRLLHQLGDRDALALQ